ncbi:MAG: GTPase ObgE [Candidatus Sericytochromatia bacterium]
MDFVDIVTIKIESGSGGNGAIHFRKEKYVPNGGPSGGDGGDGGSIILLADTSLHTLLDFKYKHKFVAESGENGRIKNQYGKKAEDLIIKVPVGTVVKDKSTDKVIADLSEKGKTFLAAKGGRGGRGNTKFATSVNKAPHYSEPGKPGIERELVLELKSIADVGLVGLPNAGKSSLLSVVSASKPKIANYPFTTLTPNLGVIKLQEGDGFVMADIPGLIEGAHKGIGLGHKFLRHVERSKLLVHIIDISAENPFFDMETIEHELILYPGNVNQKTKLVVLNKIDLLLEEEIEDIKKQFNEKGISVFCISTATRDGVNELINEISKVLPTIEVEDYIVVEEDEGVYEELTSDFEITNEEEGVFVINNTRIQRLLELTDVYDERALNRFMKIITGAGVLERLKQMNIKEGDTVQVGFFKFDYYSDEEEESVI